MTTDCALRLPIGEASCLGRLRTRSGLKVCATDDSVWLRVARLDDALRLVLRGLPGTRYRLLDDGQLIPVGRRVPEGRLPEGRWVDLAEWLAVDPPQAGFAGRIETRATLRMARSGAAAVANLLETTMERWSEYARAAPQVRLRPLAFAIDGRRRVVIRGEPLPPLIGQAFVECDGVAAPAGWRWEPAVNAEIVRQLLRLADGDLALLREDGSWDRVEANDFVRATRSAVRLSLRGVAEDPEGAGE